VVNTYLVFLRFQLMRIWLIRVARRMDIPVLACEQYPQGLGPTHPAVVEELPVGCTAAKLHFSAVAGACHGLGEAGGPAQYVVCGMETHVCVMQTVIELLELGKKVFVVEEAVGSRRESDKALGAGTHARGRREHRQPRDGGFRVAAQARRFRAFPRDQPQLPALI
jgi:hypothetical protein